MKQTVSNQEWLVLQTKYIYILCFVERCHHQGREQECSQASLQLYYSQGIQRVSGTFAQLQELVYCHHNLSIHPPVPLLLGSQLKPHLDLLLHWHPHCLLCYPHCSLHPVGQSHQLCCHQWSGGGSHCWHVSLVDLGQHFWRRTLCCNLCQKHWSGNTYVVWKHHSYWNGCSVHHSCYFHHKVEHDSWDWRGGVGENQRHWQPSQSMGCQVPGRTESWWCWKLPWQTPTRDCHQKVQSSQDHLLHCCCLLHNPLCCHLARNHAHHWHFWLLSVQHLDSHQQRLGLHCICLHCPGASVPRDQSCPQAAAEEQGRQNLHDRWTSTSLKSWYEPGLWDAKSFIFSCHTTKQKQVQ